MVRFSDDVAEHDRATREVVMWALRQCQALTLSRLVEATGVDAREIRETLRLLQHDGVLDVLEPVATKAGAGAGEQWVYYRLRRAGDAVFGWQREVEVKLPVGRMHDAGQQFGASGEDPGVATGKWLAGGRIGAMIRARERQSGQRIRS